MGSFVDLSVAEDFPLFEEEGTESPTLMLAAAAPPYNLFPEYFDLHAEMPIPGAGGPQPRVEIPRIRTTSDAGSIRSVGSDRLRATHACTKCRQRKVKCSGERPRCKHCLDFGLECEYVDGKRDRTRKEHEGLEKLCTEAIGLLKDVSLRAAPEDQRKIHHFLAKAEREYATLLSEPTSTPASPTLKRSHAAATESPLEDQKEHGEDLITAEVGSQGEPDKLDEDLTRTQESRATGFVGKNSELMWMRRLKMQDNQLSDQGDDGRAKNPYGPPGKSAEAADQRLQKSDTRRGSGNHSESNELISESTYHMDMENVFLRNHIDPYEMPLEDTGRNLLRLYLTTIQDTFPVIEKDTFTKQLLAYYDRRARGEPARPHFRWLGIVNLVFAIGAKLSHLLRAEWRADERDHLIYFTRARVLAFNGEAILMHPSLQHVQFVALMAFYFVTISHMSRAYSLCGVAVKDAIALGLHIRNEDPNLNDSKRETRIRTWWSLYCLDRLVTVILGRPSALRDHECSVPLPLPIKEDQLATFFANMATSDPPKSHGLEDLRQKSPASAAVSPLMHCVTGGEAAVPLNTDHFFKGRVELAIITGKVLTELYTASSGENSWHQAQSKIQDLVKSIDRWREKALPKEFDFSRPLAADGPFLRERLTLGFFYYSAKILAGRPFLCLVNDRIEHQTMQSKELNNKEARACVNAARAMVGLLPDKPDPAFLYKNGPWWCQIHLLMQAASILMLELSFNCGHMPHDKQNIVNALKKLGRWLHTMGKDNRAAERAFHHLSELAAKVGVDLTPPAVPLAQDVPDAKFPRHEPFLDPMQGMHGLHGVTDFMDVNHTFQPQYSTSVTQPFTTYDSMNYGTALPAYDEFGILTYASWPSALGGGYQNGFGGDGGQGQ
ncbi:hypothetical protein H2201_006710 [Coniosporium apollinis]|uniref:Zn(2)-C6 fungal-type domain-containing protein n=1 Tax=Coniosporium apollinis TaxID=61459 RepID=A0ABQ9NLG8_9PEZI|nr:hypothetical protein H2201_006710 [Coniosporium apollinis]